MTAYNRWLPPPSGPSAPELLQEATRREGGPICAQCEWCPFDQRELPPLVPGDSVPSTRTRATLTFDCEPTGRRQEVDGGRACRQFRHR